MGSAGGGGVNTDALIETERAVIGSVILSPDAFLLADVQAPHFHHPAHRLVWGAIAALHSTGQPINLITIMDHASHASVSALMLAEISSSVATSEAVGHHAGLVRQHAVDREVRQLLAARMGETDCIGGELIEAVQTALARVVLPENADGRTLTAIGREYWDDVERFFTTPEDSLAELVPTGLADVDEQLGGGMQTGATHCILASTNQGKSALAVTMARGAAGADRPTIICSFEDKAKAVFARMVAQVAGVPNRQAQRRLFTKTNVPLAFSAVSDYLHKLPIRIIDTKPRSLDLFRLQLLRNIARDQAKLVVVDYAQRVPAPGKGIYERMCNVSSMLADVADETDTAFLICSQRNAGEGNRSAKGGGELAEDAATVMVLERKKRYRQGYRLKQDQPLPVSELTITKQKNGPSDVLLPLKFIGSEVAFRDCPPDLRDAYLEGREAKE